MPSSSADRSMPIAVVMDLGSKVTYSMCPSLNSNAMANIVIPLVSTPDAMPTSIAVGFFLSIVTCS